MKSHGTNIEPFQSLQTPLGPSPVSLTPLLLIRDAEAALRIEAIRYTSIMVCIVMYVG